MFEIAGIIGTRVNPGRVEEGKRLSCPGQAELSPSSPLQSPALCITIRWQRGLARPFVLRECQAAPAPLRWWLDVAWGKKRVLRLFFEGREVGSPPRAERVLFVLQLGWSKCSSRGERGEAVAEGAAGQDEELRR